MNGPVWRTLSLILLGLSAAGVAGAQEAPVQEPPPRVKAEDYPPQPLLPDPFLRGDGSRVRTEAEWQDHRAALKQLVLDLEYGALPPALNELERHIASETWTDPPAKVDRYRITAPALPALDLEAVLYRPADASGGPWPLILAVEPLGGGNARLIVALALHRGYAIAGYQRHDLAPDAPGRNQGVYTAWPEYESGALAVWAWGAILIRGLLCSHEDIDSSRVAITGHSRAGKVALLAGALDEGFTLVCPNGSGAGGAGCYRFANKGAESLEAITQPKRFGYWFHPNLRAFAGREDRLPFDQHFLKALVAPRLLLSTEALEDHWANPRGTQVTHLAAQEVYRFLGVPERIGIHFREGKHDQTLEDWEALVDFADLHWRGKATSREFNRLPFAMEEPAWDWSAPGTP